MTPALDPVPALKIAAWFVLCVFIVIYAIICGFLAISYLPKRERIEVSVLIAALILIVLFTSKRF